MKRNRHGIFYGWWVVLTAAVALFWGIPIIVYSFSVFLKPLVRDLHTTRAAVSFAYTLRSITDAISAPAVGWLVGRFGARRLILPAAVMFGITLISIRFLSGGIGEFYVFYVLLGLTGIGLGPIAYGEVVSRWFDERRGFALGLAMLGIGCGALIIPRVTQHLITSFGWRNAYAIFGLAVLFFPVPVVAAFLKEQPQGVGLLPNGSAQADHTLPKDITAPGLSASEAWHTRTFWLMTCAFFLAGASLQGCVVHLAALLSDNGMNLRVAATGSSVLGLAVMMGRVGTGYMLDRSFAPRVASLLFGCSAAGIGLLLMGGAAPIVFFGAFLVGLGLGAEIDIIPYLIGRYFGLRSFAQIYSLVLSAFVLAGAAGSLSMGAGFDFTGSYHMPLAALLVLTLTATLFMTQLGPYQYGPRRAIASEQILAMQVKESTCAGK